jgi:hypothetical protein
MNKRILWIAARLLVMLANVLVFDALNTARTNFGILAGVLCGLVTFAALFLWMKIQGAKGERLDVIDTPFLPMGRHPRAYWLTVGLSFVVASLANLVINIHDQHAVQLFGGLMAMGLGMTLAVLCIALSEKSSSN